MSEKRYQIFATTYDKRGRILAGATNDYKKSHPLQRQLSIQVYGHPEKMYLHAELAACLRSGDKEIHRIVVQRFDSQGRPALAKPCMMCMKALELYGVKFLWYTNEYQQITKEKL